MTTKKVHIAWTPPKVEDADGNYIEYSQLKHYEVHHNISEYPSPVIIPADATSTAPGGITLPVGNYHVGIQAVSTAGYKSEKTITKFKVGDTSLLSTAKREFGVCVGGVLSSATTISSSGIFNVSDTTGWAFAGAGAPQVFTSFLPGDPVVTARFEQDCTNIATQNFSTFEADEQAIKSHYILFDYSEANDPWKLIKWEDTVFSSTNNLGIGYWYDTGTGNTTAENTFVETTGAVSVEAGSNIVTGTGTDFIDEYEVDDIIYFSSTRAAKVTYIESDIVLYMDRSFSTATSVAGTGSDKIKRQGLRIDINYDSIIYTIRNNNNTFEKYAIELDIDTEAGISGSSNALVSLYRASTDDETTTGPATFTGTITYTFSSGVVTTDGNLNSWTATVPTVAPGSYLWVRQATASSTTTSDTILIGEWSAARVISANIYNYTWVKYAENADGSVGFTDTYTAGTTLYIGHAYNKTTATESTDRTDYVWSLLGATGATGLKSSHGYLYYSTIGTAPSGPPSGGTYTWGAAVPFGTTPSGWQLNAPTLTGGAANQITYYVYWSVTQTLNTDTTSTPTYSSSVYTAHNFVGLVKFSGTNLVDGNNNSVTPLEASDLGSDGTTVIDGGRIDTGSITAREITMTSAAGQDASDLGLLSGGGVTLEETKMYIGTGTWSNTNTSFYVDNTGKFSLKSALTWDGSTLDVDGNIKSTSTIEAQNFKFDDDDTTIEFGSNVEILEDNVPVCFGVDSTVKAAAAFIGTTVGVGGRARNNTGNVGGVYGDWRESKKGWLGHRTASVYAEDNAIVDNNLTCGSLTVNSKAITPGAFGLTFPSDTPTSGDYLKFSSLADGVASMEWAAAGGGGGSGTITAVTGTSPIVSSGGTTPAISITTSAVTDGGTGVPSGNDVHDFVIGRGYTTNTGTVTGVTATGPIISSEGTAPVISVTTAAIANGGTGLATADQIHTFVTGFGYTTNTGDITSVTAGAGLTGGGTSGDATINIETDANSGITLTADKIAVNMSHFDTDDLSQGSTNKYYSDTLVNTRLANAISTGAITTTGNITASGTVQGNEVVATSDIRLKTNVKTIESSLDKVSKMRGVTFDKIEGPSSGVIAQELEEIAPELVNSNTKYKSVAYGNLVGYLIEAIKELKDKVEELENGNSSH